MRYLSGLSTISILGLSAMLPALASANGASLFLNQPFEAGVTHVAGNYSFTGNNYLVEGAQKISDLGSPSIFIYMTPDYASKYPDKGNNQFGSPKTLTDLASSSAFSKVFNMPFNVYVITVFSFGINDNIFRDQNTNTYVYNTEKAEIHDLAAYLYKTYKGTNKVFILKNWEGDWFAMRGTYNTQVDIPKNNLDDMTNWIQARQDGVAQARSEAGDPGDVAVLNAVELNLPLDYLNKGLKRVLSGVIPNVKTDMVTYSSYDSTIESGNTLDLMEAAFNQALNGISAKAADPYKLGTRRILVSEYGIYENNHPTDVNTWRMQGILDTAQSWGTSGAFLWELYDNQCDSPNGKPAPIGTAQGDPNYPKNSGCPGLWYIRPDGTTSTIAELMKPYWTGGGGNGDETITITAPGNSSYSSPVNVNAQCNGSQKADHIAVWLDGVKQGDVFSTKVNQSYTVKGNGTHSFQLQCDLANGTVLASGSAPFTLTNGGGGGNKQTITIWAPWNSSFTSPVNVNAECDGPAKTDHISVWLDGAKQGDVFSYKINQSYKVKGSGAHEFDLQCDTSNGTVLTEGSAPFTLK